MGRLNDFKVNITTITEAPKQESFGRILILDLDVDKPFKAYSSIEDVEVDFATSTDAYLMANTIFAQKPSPTEIVIHGKDLSASADLEADIISELDELKDGGKNFFGVTCTDNSTSVLVAISDWVDDNDKVYVVTTQDASDVTVVESENTLVAYHSEGEYVAESLLTYMLVRDLGTVTGKFKKLEGVSESDISNTDLATLRLNNGITYIKDTGKLQTTGSRASDGTPFDVILAKYGIKYDMEVGSVNLATRVEKIPYTNEGIAMLMDVVKNVLNVYVTSGVLTEYEISYIDRNEVPTQDIADRVYNGLAWKATLSGAIEGAEINGILTI